MDEMIQKIDERLTGKGKRLSVVCNPDGFLKRPDTQQEVLNACGLLLLPIISSLELRIRYELTDKDSNERVCYIMDNINDILPDIGLNLHFVQPFSLSELLPACNDNEIRNAQINFHMASFMYAKHFIYNLSSPETKDVIKEAKELFGQTEKELISQLDKIT